ncbi:MAG: FAD-dependent monooxygenase [Pseudomonadota bacterium]
MSGVTILGAGIGGLTTALCLERQGVAVSIIERAETLTDVGAGIQVSPNGAAVLRGLGLGEDLARIGVRAEAIRLRNGESGAEVAKLPLKRADRPYFLVHRADLIGLLAGALDAKPRLAQSVAEVAAGQPATLTFTDGRTERASMLIGADGLHSRVRAAISPDLTPKFTGQVAWRAILPATGPEPPEVQVFMGNGRHLVRYPLRGGSLINLVAVEEREGWAAEGWHHPDDPANLARAFAAFAPEIRAELDRVRDVFLWGLFRHPVAPQWHAGAAGLVGDAAHPTLPFLAQGANMAMEDAWVLSRCLADGSGAAAYQAERRARVVRITRAAEGNARNYHLPPGPARFAAHSALRLASRFAPGVLLQRFDWLYGHDVTAQPSSNR